MNAELIMSAMRVPVPWIVAAPTAMAVGLMTAREPEEFAAAMRFAANGAFRRRG